MPMVIFMVLNGNDIQCTDCRVKYDKCNMTLTVKPAGARLRPVHIAAAELNVFSCSC